MADDGVRCEIMEGALGVSPSFCAGGWRDMIRAEV